MKKLLSLLVISTFALASVAMANEAVEAPEAKTAPAGAVKKAKKGHHKKAKGKKSKKKAAAEKKEAAPGAVEGTHNEAPKAE